VAKHLPLQVHGSKNITGAQSRLEDKRQSLILKKAGKMAKLAIRRDEKVITQIPQKHICRFFDAVSLIQVEGLVYNDQCLQKFLRHFRIDGRVVQKILGGPEDATQAAAFAGALIAWFNPSATSPSTLCTASPARPNSALERTFPRHQPTQRSRQVCIVRPVSTLFTTPQQSRCVRFALVNGGRRSTTRRHQNQRT
jgi:hypothetical protein